MWEKINIGTAIDLRDDFLGLDNDEYIKSIVTKEQFASMQYNVEV